MSDSGEVRCSEDGLTPIGVVLIRSTFELGTLVATVAALEALRANGQSPLEFVQRHGEKDWGDLTADDKKLNDQALEHGDQLLSAYHLQDGRKLWIITEGDRSTTTLLLPTEG